MPRCWNNVSVWAGTIAPSKVWTGADSSESLKTYAAFCAG
jgi:hypothetical protein